MEENFIFAGFGGQGVLLAGKILAITLMVLIIQNKLCGSAA